MIRLLLIALIFAGFPATHFAAAGGAAEAAPLNPDRFEPAIRAYEQQTALGPIPAPGTAIVFLGSSTFTRWTTLGEDLPGLPVVNRGFGGSEFKDLLRYADRLLVPLRPSLVVIYCGGNDLARGTPPAGVAARATALLDRIHQLLPDARVLVLGSKIAPSRIRLRADILALNTALREACAARPYAAFADLSPLYLDAAGEPDPAWFIHDRLHLNAEGNRRLRDFLLPFLVTPRA